MKSSSRFRKNRLHSVGGAPTEIVQKAGTAIFLQENLCQTGENKVSRQENEAKIPLLLVLRGEWKHFSSKQVKFAHFANCKPSFFLL